MTQVFEDVRKHDGGELDLPDLKFRELLFIGALKRAMATTGYAEVKDLQRDEVVVSPYRPT